MKDREKYCEYSFLTLVSFLLMQIVWPSEQSLAVESDSDRYDGNGARFLLTVDGVHCRIDELKHHEYSKNTAYYSHKFKQAGLNYEIGLSLTESKILWVNGPFPAATHDITVFRRDLIHKIPAGMKAIGDSGYRGEPEFIATKSRLDPPIVRKFKSRARSRHETVNNRIKKFNCIKEQFRHGIEKHKTVFEAVCVLCQYEFEYDKPLFEM